MIAAPGIGEAAQELIDLLLGGDVDAARRVVEQDDARLGHQPFGDDDLLLVAARQRAGRDVGSAGADREELDHVADELRLAGAIDHAAARDALERGEGEVVAKRHRQHQPFRLAVLGNEGHADRRRLRRVRARGRDRRAGDPNFARYAAQHAKQRKQKLALALPVEPAEPDHFARVRMEGNVAQAIRPIQRL